MIHEQQEKEIDQMTIPDLRKFISGKVCSEPRCIRECARGYTVCIQHLHGSSDVAHSIYIYAKQRLACLTKKK